MTISKKLLIAFGIVLVTGCATGGSQQFFDSAMNDRNRAPASLQLPKQYDEAAPVIDAVHNQAEADYLFLRADLQALQGQGTASIEDLKSALVYDPQAPTIMQKLAVEYFRRGQMRDALYWAERAKTLATDRRDINMLLAGLYSSTKNYEKAAEAYSYLVKLDPEDYESMLYLGAVYSEQKNYTKAAENFKAVASEKSSNSRHLAYYYLARILLEQNEKKNAKPAQIELRKAIEQKADFMEAITLLGQLIQKEKGDEAGIKFYVDHQSKKGPIVRLAEVLSQHFIEKGNYDKAYEQLEIMDSNSEDQVQVKLKMALILIDKKIYDLAIDKLESILKIAPESDKVRFYLSAVHEEKKQFSNAFDEYMKINKESSYFEEARVHAAYIAKIQGDADRGQKVLGEVEKVTNVQTYFLMSQFHEDKEELEQAINVVRKAQKSFPKNPQAFFYEGTLLDKQNKKPEMLISMERALELDPENAQTMNYIAFSLAEIGGDLERAEQLAREAARREKADGFILDTLGWVLFKKGDYREAIAVLEKAHTLQPAVGVIAEHLGDAYIKLQKFDKARALFLKATELENDQSRKKEIQTKLSKLESDIKTQLRQPASVDGGKRTSASP